MHHVDRRVATLSSTGARTRTGGLLRRLRVAAVALATLAMCGHVLAEGSRTLHPTGTTGGRTVMNLRNALYAGVARERQFTYVYAEAGEYILVASSNRTVAANGGDISIFNPQAGGFGTRGDETIPGTASFSCAAATPPAGSFSGGSRGIIASRNAELAGPNSVDGTQTATDGYAPCAYRAPTTGIYGVTFTGAPSAAAGDANGNLATVQPMRTDVLSWDVTVRSSVSTRTDLNARVFTYAFGTFGTALISPRLYYATSDGYRYEQVLRGINTGGAAFYANRSGFLDNGQPLYHDVRGTNQPVSTGFPAGVVAQPPQFPIFFSGITGAPNGAQADKVLGALGIPLVPPVPQLNTVSFTGNLGSANSSEGAGGIFQFTTVNTLTFEIVISADGVNFDPALAANRVITGTALSGTHSIAWDGTNNAGTPFAGAPSPGNAYTFRINGRNGEIHFPIIDIEGNATGGPTLNKLNGSGGSTVYFDDRGYVTRNNIAVGVRNGHLCGAGSAQVQPTPTHSLLGINSNALIDATRYYRHWPGNNDPNTDCNSNANVYFGTAKALDLWALEKTTDINQQINVLPPPPPADLGAQVTATSAVGPGETIHATLTYSNNGGQNATGVTYALRIGTAGNCPTALAFPLLPGGAAFTYNASTCVVTFTGLPTTLTPGQDLNFNMSYTAPASGSVPVVATVQGTQDPLPGTNSPNTATATTQIVSADVAISKAAPTSAAPGAPIAYTVRAWNNGPSVANGVLLSDSVSTTLTGVTWTCTGFGGATCATTSGSGNGISVSVNLPVDTGSATTADTAYVQLLINGTVGATGALVNTASAQTPLGMSDPTPGNNSATVTTQVRSADLSIAKTLTGVLTRGQPASYTLAVTNNGPTDATNITVLDTLPTGLAFVSAAGTGWTCSFTTPQVSCTRPALDVGAAPAITLQVTVAADASGSIANIATVGASTSDPTPGNNSNTSTNGVQVPPDAVNDGPVTVAFGTATPITVLTNDIAGSAPLNAASVTVTTPSPNGSTLVNGDGTITFTPTGNFTGPTSFTYQVCDTTSPTPLCDTATVSVVVAPQANDDSASTGAGQPITGATVTGNDFAPPGSTYSVVTNPASGTLVLDPQGGYSYTPAPNTAGVVSFTYQVCLPAPNQAVCDPATVTIVIAPLAQADTNGTPQNTPVGGSVAGNDAAPPDAVYTVPTQPANGSIVMNPDGSYTYTPNPGFSGTDVITYQVCLPAPNASTCSTATLTITVAGNSVAANDDVDGTAQNTAVTTVVLQNDTVAAGGSALDPASVTITVQSPNGTAVANPDGTVTFTPATNFSGTTTYTYQVCDTSSPTPVCDTAVVEVTVAPNVVDAANDGASTPQNTPVTTSVLVNDGVSPGGAPLDPGSLAIVSQSPNGTATVNPDGTIAFQPNPGFSGTATYTYEVCDTSTPTPVCDTATVQVLVGSNLVGAVDDAASTAQNTSVTTFVLANDTTTGAPLNPASVTVTVPPSSGTATPNPDGSITFEPAPNFAGQVTYTYQVCDTSNPTPVCDTAVVTVTVQPNAVDALNDNATTAQNTPVTTTVLGNDSVSPNGAPLDPASVTITVPSPNGTLDVNPDGSIEFTPATNFSGVTTYTYEVCDVSVPDPVCDTAIVTVTVGNNSIDTDDDTDSTPQNTPVTTTVLANDSSTGAALDPASVSIVAQSAHGNAVANPDGTITFTPDPGYSGLATYTYQVCDLSTPTPVCASALVTITVGANTVSANDDADSTPQNTAVTVAMLGNDTVGSGGAALNPASVTIVTPPANGSVVVNADGSTTFTPATNFSGIATYTYQVCDLSTPVPVCDTATVSVTVQPNVVTALDDSASTPQNTPVNTVVLSNDGVLPNGAALDPASVTVTVQSPNGTAEVQPDGSITFTPNAGFTGVASYTYQVCDVSTPTPVCDTAVVFVNVGANSLDVENDSDTTPQNTPVTTLVLANDGSTGAPLNPGSLSIVAQSANGTAVANPDGTVTFTPAQNFSGTTTYTYQVCDTSTPTPLCAVATVTVVVQPNVVTAGADGAVTAQNTPVTTNVLGNDTVLPNGAPLDPASVVVTQQSPNGTATVNPDGSITFVPNPGFSGTTTYTYRVCDLSVPTPVCATAVVTVSVGDNLVAAIDDNGSTPQNTPVTTNVTGNDTSTGAPLNPASVAITAQSPNGTAVANGDGTVTFTPADGFSGTTTYSYRVCDTSTPTPVCDIAVVTIVVQPNGINANNDVDNTPQNTPVTTTVLGNDTVTGAALDPASVTVVTQSPNGTTSVNPDGSIVFTPNANFSGVTTYVYRVCDTSTPTPVCDTAVVTITVGASTVTANDDAGTTTQNTPVTTSVLGNDSSTGAPLDPASITIIAPSPDGIAVPNADGTITFTPNPGFSGVTTYSYQVCDTSTPTPVCDAALVTITIPPNAVAALNDNATTPQNTPVTVAVLGNDTTTAAPLNPGSVHVTVPSPDGSTAVNPDGSIVFTPNPGFSGITTFTYEVCDTSSPVPVCDTAIVTVTVGTSTVTAVDDNDTTPQNTPVTTTVLTNDSSSGPALNPASVAIVAQSADGTAVANANGTITFTPNPGFSGTTTYTYSVCDTSNPTPQCATALVTIVVGAATVTAVDDNDSTPQNTPVTTTVLGNDSSTGPALDPGSVSIVVPSPNGNLQVNADGSITFTPNLGFSGTTTYTYRVCDTSTPVPACDTAVVTIVVGGGTVTAVDDNDSTPVNTPVTTPVLGNDSTGGQPLDPGSVTVTVPSPNGDTTVNPDGSITFVPDPGFTGTTTYTYRVCDTSTPTPVCDTAVVTIVVIAGTVNAANDNATTPQDTPVTIVVLGNDTSTGQPLDPGSVTVTVPSPDGDTTVNPDGSIVFTPNPGFSGTTTFTYRVCDTSTPTPVCDTAIVQVIVPAPGTPTADLTVRKTGPANADAGDEIVFTIEVANLGPDTASAVVLSDPTPAGLQFVANAGDCTTAFPCSLGDLAVGDTRTVQATFLVPADYSGPSTITNIAAVSSATLDPTPGDTSSSASTIVQGGTEPPPMPEPTRIPADGRWAMLLLGLATLLIAGLRLRRA